MARPTRTIDPRTSADDGRRGLLLVGHGTRDRAGTAEFLALADSVAVMLPELAVEPCFLELAEPSIAEGARRLLDRRVRQVTVMPVLLFAAGHARHDIPEAVAEAFAANPEVAISQAEPLGCHPLVVQLSAQRYQESLDGRAGIPPRETALVMVGRGSLDPSATAEMHRFSSLRGAETPVGRVETCFIAMARPSLPDALHALAGSDYRRIVVQPHLLFEGELLDDVRRRVNELAAADGMHEWIVTSHLGSSPLLARAVADRTLHGQPRSESTRS